MCLPFQEYGKWLVAIGALNWGLVGLGQLFYNVPTWNLIYLVFGAIPWLEALIYLVIGIYGGEMLYHFAGFDKMMPKPEKKKRR